MKKTLSLTIEENTYQEVKQTILAGAVSSLVNNFLKEYLKKEREKKLIEAYKRQAKNKKLQKELKAMEEVQFEDLNNG
ncbi:MAG: hypothetical protein MRERC_2c083 [Mycoplasmataceae bacterium RC_NB112A]|nr:MAG: hypothetical protein MRERC_2c083 [Mycoplasmataceae bacterium RC_NB112A]